MSNKTPAFNPTDNQEVDKVNRPIDEVDEVLTDNQIDTKIKLKNFKPKEINFNEAAVQNKLKNIINRELPQPFPIKSQIPEIFTSEYIMKPIDLTKVKR